MAPKSPVDWTAWLKPLDVRTFVERHFGREALHTPGRPSTLGELARLGDWRRAGALGHVDAATRDEAGRQVQLRADRESLEGWYARGATLCGDISTDPAVAFVLERIGRDLGLPPGGFAKLYASPPAAGFAVHWDGDHVLVVQLRGRKRWWYSAQPALAFALHSAKAGPDGSAVWAAPREGPVLGDDGAPIAVPAQADMVSVVLAPGDVLYLPPGCWHATEAVTASVAISMSPARRPVLNPLIAALGEAAAIDPACRVDLLDGDPAASHRALQAGLRALGLRLASIVSAAPPPETTSIAAPPRGPVDRVRRVDSTLSVTVERAPGRGESVVVLHGADGQWELPIEARELALALVRDGVLDVAAAEAPGSKVTPEDLRDLLQQLLEAGLVVPDA